MPPRKSTPIALEPTSSPRTPRKRRRPGEPAQAIVAAAESCFSRWGIQRTRVEDIAAEAGVPRPHVYRHFASKEAIVHAVVLRAIRRHHERLAERFPIEGPAAPLILGTLVSGVTDAAEDVQSLTREDSAQLTARSLADSPEIVAALRAHWEPVLEHARQRGELREGIDIDATTRWLVFVQFSFLALPRIGDPAPVEDDLRRFVLPALLRDDAVGLGSPA